MIWAEVRAEVAALPSLGGRGREGVRTERSELMTEPLVADSLDRSWNEDEIEDDGLRGSYSSTGSEPSLLEPRGRKALHHGEGPHGEGPLRSQAVRWSSPADFNIRDVRLGRPHTAEVGVRQDMAAAAAWGEVHEPEDGEEERSESSAL